MLKKSIYLFLMAILLCDGYGFSQQEDEILKETVRVVNVEVPVRVYDQGRPVDHLTRNDFKLSEGRKNQEINGFIIKRKKIKAQDLEFNIDEESTWEGRYFVLVFRITHYNDYLKDGLDYVFDKIFREQDQLLVFANDHSAFFKNLEDKISIRTELDMILSNVSLEARNKTLLYLSLIEKEVDKHNFEMNLRQPGWGGANLHYIISEYLTKFIDIWKNYKRKFLIPDINNYYTFAQFLNKIDKEKWVINFYQFEVFPDIFLDGESMRRIRALIGEWQISETQELVTFSQILSRQLTEAERELSVAKDFPSEEVAKIFHNVDATFHSIFMKTTLSAIQQDVAYKEVASDLESSLRAITYRTGGKLVVTNKLKIALDRISEVEDVYYVLTYAPKDPDKVGKIKVKLNNRKYDLVYSPNLRTGYLSQFLEDKQTKGKNPSIMDLKFEKGKLRFGITDFTWVEKKGGIISIRIRLNNSQGESVFNQEKTIKANQKKINIALTISGIEKGEYDAVVDVLDLLTKMSGSQLLKITLSIQP